MDAAAAEEEKNRISQYEENARKNPAGSLIYGMRDTGREMTDKAREALKNATPKDMTFWQEATVTAARSLGIALPGVLASVATRSPAPALGAMGLAEFGSSFDENIRAGMNPEKARQAAIMSAGVEAYTEVVPLNKLLSLLPNQGMSIFKKMVKMYIPEIAQENLATLGQDAIQFAAKNPGATFKDWYEGYIKNIPEQAARTTASTLISSTIQTGGAQAAHSLLRAGKKDSSTGQPTKELTDTEVFGQAPVTTPESATVEQPQTPAAAEMTDADIGIVPRETPADLTEKYPFVGSLPAKEAVPATSLDTPEKPLYSRKGEDKTAVDVFDAIAGNKKNFQYKTSEASDLGGVVKDMAEGRSWKVAKRGDQIVLAVPKQTETGVDYSEFMTIHDTNTDTPHVTIGDPDKKGAEGSRAYQIAMTWAHNNGKTLVPDRVITVVNRLRRSEAMISSAMRHKTTRHLDPHPDQYVGLLSDEDYNRLQEYKSKSPVSTEDAGVKDKLLKLKEQLWTPESPNNTPAKNREIYRSNVYNLLKASSELAHRRSPELNQYSFDKEGNVYESRTGKPIDDLSKIPQSQAEIDRGIGGTTRLRSVIARSFLRPSPEVSRGPVRTPAPTRPARESVLHPEVVLEERGERIVLAADDLERIAQSPAVTRSLYSKSPRHGGLTQQSVQATIAPVLSRWKNGPEVTVVQSTADIPDNAVPHDVEGAYVGNGRIYLVADNLQSKQRVLQVLAHEAVGHAAMEELFGKDLKLILDGVRYLEKTSPQVRKIGQLVDETQPGLSEENRAKEIIAMMAERGMHNSLMRRVIAAIQNFLRSLGINIDLNLSDLAAMLRASERYLEAGTSQTQTPEFKKWFGDSKVVDENGKPLVLYHGGTDSIERFDLAKTKEEGTVGRAFYFTPDPQYAGFFAAGATGAKGAPIVTPVFIHAENPLNFRTDVTVADLKKLTDVGAINTDFQMEAPITHLDMFRFLSDRDGNEKAAKYYWDAGWDALIFYKTTGEETIAVRNPEQIKSAIGNRGTFDPSSPNILFSRQQSDKGVSDFHNRALQKLSDALGIARKDIQVLRPAAARQPGLLNPFRSPNKVAEKFPPFRPFFAAAERSHAIQERLRMTFQKRLAHVDNILREGKSKLFGRETYRQNTELLQDIRLTEDMLGREFSDEVLKTEFNAPESVIKAKHQMRAAYNHALTMANQHRELRGKMPISRREGYVPHFFHNYFVIADGQVQASARTLVEATRMGNDAVKSGMKNVIIRPKQFEFPGGDVQAAVIGDIDYFQMQKNIQEQQELTLDEAKQMMEGFVRRRGRSRFVGNFLRRKGAKGFETNLAWVDRHYFNMIARYVAMDAFKARTISLFERTFGAFDKEHKGLANYVKNYIKDINGVPTDVENLMNATIARTPWLGKFLGTYLGDRPSLHLAGMTTGAVAIAKLGLYNAASAAVNLTQLNAVQTLIGPVATANGLRLALQAEAVRLGRKVGAFEDAHRDLGVLKQAGIEYAQGLESGSGYSKVHQLGKLFSASTAFFQGAERILRQTAVLGAYHKYLAKNPGKGKEALAYAKQVNNRANYDYSIVDTPSFIRRTGPLGQILFQFKKYPVKTLELVASLKGAEHARFWIPLFLMAGYFAFPGMDALKRLLKSLFDFDMELEMKKHLLGWAGKSKERLAVAKTIMYGAFSQEKLGGVDISRRIGHGDFIPSEIDDLFGPALSTAVRTVQLASRGEWVAMLKAMATAPGNIVEAMTSDGQITDPWRRGRLSARLGTGELVAKGLGFRPTREALEADVSRIIEYETRQVTMARQRVVDHIIRAAQEGERARARGDQQGMENAERMAKAAMDRAEKYQIPITPEQIKNEIKAKNLTKAERAWLNSSKIIKARIGPVMEAYQTETEK